MSGGDAFFLPLPGSPSGGNSVLDWVSVQDDAYGATGDGSTDDTVAIQAALDATPQGGVCYFPVPASAYRVTAPLNIPHTMRVAGGGSFIGRYTKITQATPNTSLFVSPSAGSQHITVEGLQLIGTIGGQTAGAAIDTSQSIQVSRCYVQGFYDGLRVTVDSVANDHAYYCHAEHSFFDSATRAAVRLAGIINNFSWLNCRANGSGVGVQVVGGPFGIQLYGGAIEHNTLGLDLDGNDSLTGQDTASVLISGVYFEQFDTLTDIRIGNTSRVYAVKIEACPFIKPNLTGGGWHIDAVDVEGLSIDGCTFSSTDAVDVAGSGVVYGRNYNLNGGTVTLPAGSVRIDAANVTPEPVAATAAVGTSHYLARADHVHEGATDTEITPEQVRDAGRWEVVVDGNPATAVTTPDGTDWVYGWITT